MSDAFLDALQGDITTMRGGQGVHTMAVGPADVHIDAALSNLAVAFRPNDNVYIADRVLPVVRVGRRSDKFFKFAPAAHLDLNRANIASQMGMPAVSNYSIASDAFAVNDFGLRDFVPADVESNADMPLRPLMDTTEILTDRLMLAREYRVANFVADTGNYGSNVLPLSGGSQWDVATSDPVLAIETAKNAMLMSPNVLVLGQEVWTALRRHPAIERYILARSSTRSGAVPLTITQDLFAEAFELDAVIVGKAKYNTAAPGAALSTSYLWGKFAALLRVDPTAAMQRTSTFAYTFRYAPTGAMPFETRVWQDVALGVRGGTWVKVTHSDTEKSIGGQYAGFLFTGAVS